MINLDAEDFDELLIILKTYLKRCDVYAFGSRVRGGFKKFSDLDICIVGEEKVPFEVMSDLMEALSGSSIQVHVDVVDIHTISEEFKSVIQRTDKVLISSREINREGSDSIEIHISEDKNDAKPK